jgi:hypothetical protein
LDLPGFGKEVNWSFFGEKNLTKDSYLTKCLVQLANIAKVFFFCEATPWHAWNQTIPWLEKGHLKTLTSLDKRD